MRHIHLVIEILDAETLPEVPEHLGAVFLKLKMAGKVLSVTKESSS